MFSISGSGFAPTVAPAAVRSAAVSPVMAIERSASIPFLKRPPALDGTMVGDVGFDPLGITTTISPNPSPNPDPNPDPDPNPSPSPNPDLSAFLGEPSQEPFLKARGIL